MQSFVMHPQSNANIACNLVATILQTFHGDGGWLSLLQSRVARAYAHHVTPPGVTIAGHIGIVWVFPCYIGLLIFGYPEPRHRVVPRLVHRIPVAYTKVVLKLVVRTDREP